MNRVAPAISVCIPVRNGEEQLRHTLLNLLVHSSYPTDRWEVVLGDHGSTDGTAAMIAAFAERFPRVRGIHVPYEGPNRAHVRNRLIESSRGDLLVFIDHDVLVSDDFLWKHVEAHEVFSSSIVAGAIFGAVLEGDVGGALGRLELDHISASRDVLAASEEYADPRLPPNWPPDAGETLEVSRAPAPFRLFWGGNVSACRADIDACGRFDETYNGWGLEDDDFAQQFRVRGRGMVLSRSAWAFHMPGVPHDLTHVGQWRRNFETFFRKFATREIEGYGVYGSALLPIGLARLDGLLGELRRIDTGPAFAAVAARLGVSPGRRLAHLVADPRTAETLQLTDALSPFGDVTEPHRYERRTHWWPLVGLKTPFADHEIDEAVVSVDVMMWLDPYLLTLLLSETARIAKHVVFCTGPHAEVHAGGFPARTLREIANRLHFAGVTWMKVEEPAEREELQ